MQVADDFTAWLEQADIPESCRTEELDALLRAVFRFRQEQGTDYYSTRLLSHFLLNCDTGLKVAVIARLLGIARPTASRQQNLSSKEAIGQAHHRMDGRPYGKLLPRYAGPIAAFLLSHQQATRADVLDFIKRTFGVQVSRIALYKFLKKYGLQEVHQPAQVSAQPDPALEPVQSSTASASAPSVAPAPPRVADPLVPAPQPAPATAEAPLPLPAPEKVPLALPAPEKVPLALPAPATASMPLALPAPAVEAASAPVFVPAVPPAPPFCSDERNTPEPSCFWAMPSTG